MNKEIIIPVFKVTALLCIILLFIAFIIFVKEYITKTGFFKTKSLGVKNE